MKRQMLAAALIATGMLGALGGCAGKTGSWFENQDYHDTSEDPDESWDFVGKEGRGGQPVERDPDQWWRKYVISEKHREIERNLGVE